jgi:hypothetical protein
MRVRILHNQNFRDAVCFGYRDGDQLAEVHAFDLPTTERDPFAIAEAVYAITNSYPEELHSAASRHPELVAGYRARKVRSLSKGDVVVLADEIGLAVASIGFERVSRFPTFAFQRKGA